MRMMCPHCSEFAYTRTSSPLTNTSRETIFQCRNIDCGHVFSAVTEINRTIVPSARPNPQVILPMGVRIRRTEEGSQPHKAMKPPSQPKFRNPDTGATWTGHGRAPGWIAGKDRAPFQINPDA
ncbi:hypothetical protein HMPREF9701_05456 [Delftia acidovorans CCUG 274B]|uniref:ogr/Delta-like zinc finger family protein n=1 Tax=Delftia acidovorans TaxID=80866 RepID=UPI0003529C43|nr:ogr/Delta-like zinc finger family protein [Delftia acidovorans]EPD35077.1 hypothetical protein HMPREF9701_05456 [Delftia acidovorans CCUG 274B]